MRLYALLGQLGLASVCARTLRASSSALLRAVRRCCPATSAHDGLAARGNGAAPVTAIVVSVAVG